MTIPSIIYGQYQPAQIKVVNLGIALSDATNDALNFTPTQHLIVGEKENGLLSLIVDNTGVAINTTLPTRTNSVSQYALYVDGDVFVTGNIITNGTAGGAGGVIYGSGGAGGGGVGVGSTGTGSAGAAPWNYSDTYNNIWFPGTATLGNFKQSSNTGYTLNIIQSADRTIEHAQISVQNTEYAQLRVGIVGTAANSPAIVNTPPGTKLEFHIGRDQSYFTQLYASSNFVRVDYDSGNYSNVMVVTPDEVPHYEYYTQAVAPNIIIDTDGNIGIHTSRNIPISYQLRVPDPTKPQNIGYPWVTEPMAVHVAGSTYTSNLIIYDYESGTPKNVDELYVRRLGVTIPANQINPGPFGNGNYSFVSNLSLTGGDMSVSGNEHIYQDLMVDGSSIMNQIIAKDAILVDVASFCNDVYVNRDIIVNHSIRLRGQIFSEILSNIDFIDGVVRSNYAWQMINFAPASPSLSNINYIGQGISTPGRLGVGVDPYNDEVNNQLSVFKRDPNIFELELHDMSDSSYRKGAFIGHPRMDAQMSPDGSLAIATPALHDNDYIGGHNNGVPQNIYFFPGTDMGPSAQPMIRYSNPPTLGLFYNNTVGIGTYEPLSTVDVRGTITFTGDLQYYDTSVNIISKLGLWKAKNFSAVDPNTLANINFKGIQFLNNDSSNVAINVNPEPGYALVVGNGGIKSYNGYFTGENRKIVPWMDSTDALTVANNVAPPAASRYGLFTYGNVGIGTLQPQSTMEIKSNYSDGTLVRLFRGDFSAAQTTAIDFVGTDYWRMQANDLRKSFEIGYGSNTFTSDSNQRAMWMKYNQLTGKQQVVIGDSLLALDLSAANIDPYAALSVGGNLAVNGDVNITGSFKINSQVLENNSIQNNIVYPSLEPDDVYIGGGYVILTPGTNTDGTSKSVVIGNPGTSLASSSDTALLRVYQQNSTPVLAIFHTTGKTGLISIMDKNAHELRFGILDPVANSGSVFAFMDQNNSPYLSFQDPTTTADRYTGFNTLAPSSILHVSTQGSGSNMLRLTKNVVGGDTSSAAPQIDLEKTYQRQTPTRWSIVGPNAAFGQKLSFVYQDAAMTTAGTPPNEMFCFTNNGCIGIGTNAPEFSLDVNSTGKTGSLRLLNTDSQASPQILFQSGCNIYGEDPSFDFRMAAYNNQFTIDMQNIYQTITVMNVNSVGNVGFKSPAAADYEMLVNGSINITGGIYLNGARLFSTGGSSSLDQGLPLAATNIFLEPVTNYKGGVVINGSYQTSNLFHIFSGRNANMMVLDSAYSEAQVHFRDTVSIYNPADGSFSTQQNMYRMSMNANAFQWEYWGNCTSASEILTDHADYLQVVKWAPSKRLVPGAVNDFDTVFNGTMQLNTSNPSYILGTQGALSAANGSVAITTAVNVGIGTTTPFYFTHIVNRNPVAALHIDQNTNADALHINTNGTQKVTVNYSGNVGIGTGAPRAALDIAAGQIYTASGTSFAPSYTFASDNRTGTYLYSPNTLGIAAAGQNIVKVSPTSVAMQQCVAINNMSNAGFPALSVVQMFSSANVAEFGTINNTKLLIVDQTGNVGVGTAAPVYPLHVNGNVGVAGALLPLQNVTYDIGAPTMRWRDIYLSGTTIDLGGTKLSRVDTDGSVKVSDGGGLQKIIANQIQLGDATTPSTIQIQIGQFNNVQFSSTNNATQQTVQFTPLFLNNDALSVGIGVAQGALHIVSNSNLPAAIINQNSTGDILQLYQTSVNRVITVNQAGNLGIGTATPAYPLAVSANNSSYAAAIQQRNAGGNVATFANAIGSQIIIDRNGYLGVNTLNPTVPLHVTGGQFYDGFANFNSNVYVNGNLEVYGDAVAHGNQVVDSDVRLKDDLVRIENALAKVESLTGYTFTKKDTGKRSTGLIAQEVEAILPEAVCTDREYLGLAYGNMMGLIVESIKELSQEIKNIYNRLE